MFLTELDARLLNDRAKMPWQLIAPLEYEDPLTGEIYTVPKWFRTDGASLPAALVALPVIGQLLFIRYFGQGVFQGFREGVLHDYLLRSGVVPASVAHRVFRTALYEAGYSPDLVETYYAAVVAAN